MTPSAFFRLFFIYGILLAPFTAHAANDSSPGFVEKRKLLAQEFVNRLKGKVRASESPVVSSESTLLQAVNDADALSQIAVGSEILFRPRIDRYTLNFEIYAIKGE